ncbi:MAG: penicillin-binding protein activator [Thermoanaerobaculia bacterium]
MTKRNLGVAFSAVVIFFLAGVLLFRKPSPVTAPPMPQAAQAELRIGVVLPFSGSMAEYGQNAKEGLLLASEELKRDTSAPKLTLIFQDTTDNPTGTVDAVKRLIDVDRAKYIIGGLTSTGVLNAAPYAQQSGVLFFTPAASAPGIPDIGNLIFRNWPSDDLIARLFGDAAFRRIGARSLALYHVSNDYGTTNANVFKAAFSAAGGRVSLERSFTQGTTDFRQLVTQLRAEKGIDTVFLIAYPDEYRAAFRELSKQGVGRLRILVSDTFYSPQLGEELAEPAEGAFCAVASKPGDDYLPRKRFREAYRLMFRDANGKQKEPGLASDTAYDALKLVVAGIRATDGTPTAVSAWLLNQRDYEGAVGKTTFTTSGDFVGSLSVFRLKMGKFQFQF